MILMILRYIDVGQVQERESAYEETLLINNFCTTYHLGISELSVPAPGATELHFSSQYSQTFFNRSSRIDLFNAMGSMDSACLFLGVQNSESAEPVVDVERTVYYRERAAGMYSAAAYAFAQAFRANNVESAKSRLNLCAKDIREQLGRLGNTSELCSQLGAVLGMLGYCCRATGDASSAVSHFKESVNFLSKVSSDDLESPWWFVMVIILLNEKTTKASSVKPPKAEECDEGEDDDGDLKGVL